LPAAALALLIPSSLLVCLGQSAHPSASAPPAALSDKEIIRRTRAAYYSLSELGLSKFQVTAAPEWKKYIAEVMPTQHGSTQPDAQKIAQMEEVQYSVSVSGEGTVTVKPFRSGGGEIDPALDQTVDGMRQMLQGFYTTWLPMVFTNPFPDPEAPYSIKREQEKYRVLTQNGDSAAEIVLDKNYLATEMTVDTPQFKVKIAPVYQKTAKGLLLTSIDSEINGGQMKVYVSIDYKAVQGFELPDHVLYKVPMADKPGSMITVESWFVHYQLN